MILDLGRPPGQARADFEYSIVNAGAAPSLQIIDLNRGKMSVTNDVEAVIFQIWREIAPHYDILDMVISYRDSQGDWDFIELTPIADRVNAYSLEIKPGFHCVDKGILG